MLSNSKAIAPAVGVLPNRDDADVRPRLGDLGASASAGGNANTSVELAPVSDGAIAEAKLAVGIDLAGYRHTVDMFAFDMR